MLLVKVKVTAQVVSLKLVQCCSVSVRNTEE